MVSGIFSLYPKLILLIGYFLRRSKALNSHTGPKGRNNYSEDSREIKAKHKAKEKERRKRKRETAGEKGGRGERGERGRKGEKGGEKGRKGQKEKINP